MVAEEVARAQRQKCHCRQSKQTWAAEAENDENLSTEPENEVDEPVEEPEYEAR